MAERDDPQPAADGFPAWRRAPHWDDDGLRVGIQGTGVLRFSPAARAFLGPYVVYAWGATRHEIVFTPVAATFPGAYACDERPGRAYHLSLTAFLRAGGHNPEEVKGKYPLRAEAGALVLDLADRLRPGQRG